MTGWESQDIKITEFVPKAHKQLGAKWNGHHEAFPELMHIWIFLQYLCKRKGGKDEEGFVSTHLEIENHHSSEWFLLCQRPWSLLLPRECDVEH